MTGNSADKNWALVLILVNVELQHGQGPKIKRYIWNNINSREDQEEDEEDVLVMSVDDIRSSDLIIENYG